MAAEVDELHQRIPEKMVCSIERTSVLLQVLKLKVVSDIILPLSTCFQDGGQQCEFRE